MAFKAVATHPTEKVIVYLHETGSELFGYGSSNQGVMLANAQKYCLDSLREHSFIGVEPEYVITNAWGDVESDRKILDVFAFRDIKTWPGNPGIRMTQFADENGRVEYIEYDNFCGDGAIMLGQEELMRRACKNLEEYFSLTRTIVQGIPMIFPKDSSIRYPRDLEEQQ